MEKKTSTEKFEITNEKKNSKRLQWDRPSEFMFALLGYCVGLGMFWRFPYLCYRNGGGAFLVPFLLACVLMALPLYTFEVGLGQFTKRGKLGAWDRIPLMKGLAWASLFISTWCMIAYMSIMAWCILFFVNSFTFDALPWTTCDNDWNTESCVSLDDFKAINTTSLSPTNLSSNGKPNLVANATGNITFPQVEFWRRHVLRQSSGFTDFGDFNGTMFGYLVAAFVTVFAVTIMGVKSSGKVVYFTASFPYIMLVVLFIRGLTLEGAYEGIKVFLLPDMRVLLKPSVWMEGISQAFNIFGIGFSALTAFGSYNKKRQDFFQQSVFVIPCGIVTSIVMGFVTFSILGHLALKTNADIREVVESGPGLVFQVIPVALSLMPFAPVWSALFFLMLYFVAIDSAFSEFEGISTMLTDAFPSLVSTWKKRALTNCGIGTAFFLAAQLMITGAGVYWFELFNYYGGLGICLIWVAMLESIAVGWLWNAERYRKDVKLMTGRRVPVVMDYSYKYCIPAITAAVFLFYCINWSPLKVGDYEYPIGANILGWCLSLSSILCVPILAVKSLLSGPGSLRQRWNSAITSKKDFSLLHMDMDEDKKLGKYIDTAETKHLTSV